MLQRQILHERHRAVRVLPLGADAGVVDEPDGLGRDLQHLRGALPERRGLASSLQAVVGSTANGIVAGLLAPLVMHSTIELAVASFGLMCIGLVSWQVVKRRVRTS